MLKVTPMADTAVSASGSRPAIITTICTHHPNFCQACSLWLFHLFHWIRNLSSVVPHVHAWGIIVMICLAEGAAKQDICRVCNVQ